MKIISQIILALIVACQYSCTSFKYDKGKVNNQPPIKTIHVLGGKKVHEVEKDSQMVFIYRKHNGLGGISGHKAFFDQNGFNYKTIPLGKYKNFISEDSMSKLDANYNFYLNKSEQKRAKASKSQQMSWPKNIFNPFIINPIKWGYKKKYREETNMWEIHNRTSSKFGHEYKFKNNGHIKSEKKVFLIFKYEKDLPKIADKDILYNVDYQYNDQDQLIRKDYHFLVEEDALHTDMDIDHYLTIPINESPVELYTYDGQGRMTSVKTYKTPERAEKKGHATFYEEYTYEDDQLVKLKRYKPNGARILESRIREIKNIYFNQHGDAIKVEALEDDGETVFETYYYKYEYDQHNNWTKREDYYVKMKDQPDDVIKRKITYYSKEELN